MPLQLQILHLQKKNLDPLEINGHTIVCTCKLNYVLSSIDLSANYSHELQLIDERSEPPSDKLGGDICIASHVLVRLSL